MLLSVLLILLFFSSTKRKATLLFEISNILLFVCVNVMACTFAEKARKASKQSTAVIILRATVN